MGRGVNRAGRQPARSATVSSSAALQPTSSMALANLGRTGTIGVTSRSVREAPSSETPIEAANASRPRELKCVRPAISLAGRSRARYAATKYTSGRTSSRIRSYEAPQMSATAALVLRISVERVRVISTWNVRRWAAREEASKDPDGRSIAGHDTMRRQGKIPRRSRPLTGRIRPCYGALPFCSGGRRIAGKAAQRWRRGRRGIVPARGAVPRRELAVGGFGGAVDGDRLVRRSQVAY